MEKLLYLINYLAKESKIDIGELPSSEIELKNLFRSLMNMRPPNDISEDYLKVEDEFLQEELDKKFITDIENLKPIKNNLYLWKGDITALKIDAIVNAANSAMLGCFYPMHKCYLLYDFLFRQKVRTGKVPLRLSLNKLLPLR